MTILLVLGIATESFAMLFENYHFLPIVRKHFPPDQLLFLSNFPDGQFKSDINLLNVEDGNIVSLTSDEWFE